MLNNTNNNVSFAAAAAVVKYLSVYFQERERIEYFHKIYIMQFQTTVVHRQHKNYPDKIADNALKIYLDEITDNTRIYLSR